MSQACDLARQLAGRYMMQTPPVGSEGMAANVTDIPWTEWNLTWSFVRSIPVFTERVRRPVGKDQDDQRQGVNRDVLVLVE